MPSRSRTHQVGLLALASLVACTGPAAPSPTLSRAGGGATATIATFEGRYDPASGALTIRTEPSGDAAGRLGRSVFQPYQDGTPGSGPADTFELVTDASPAPGVDPVGCGGVGSFDGSITLRSFFGGLAFSNVAIQLTEVTTGHEACNSAAPADGLSAALGYWDYGAIGVKGSPSAPLDNRSVRWSFRFAASEAFTFRGRIMAQVAPLPAPANPLWSFEWTPSMFMDPPHSFQDVGTTLAHVVWNGTAFVDTQGRITFQKVGAPTSASVGLVYPAQAYARGFTGANYFVADAAHGGSAIDTTGDFTVCAKFKPGVNPGADAYKVIVAKGDPVSADPSSGWALAHFGPIFGGPEPEYSFMHRTGLDGGSIRSIYGPQGLPGDPDGRAYEYVCGGGNAGNVQVGAFGQVAGTAYAVGAAVSNALPLVIGAAAGGTYPYTDGGVYEIIFDSRPVSLTLMNEIVAMAEGRVTYYGASAAGSGSAGTSVAGADLATYLLPQGANVPVTTDASGLLDAGKSVAFGGTTTGLGPVLPAGTTEYCIGAEVTAADWATASGCVLGSGGGGELGIFFTSGTIAGTNGSAFRALVSPVPDAGRHKVMVCYAPPAIPATGQAQLYVDGTLAGTTSADGGNAFDIVTGQLQVGTCNLAGLLTGARIGRVFACPTANPASCN